MPDGWGKSAGTGVRALDAILVDFFRQWAQVHALVRNTSSNRYILISDRENDLVKRFANHMTDEHSGLIYDILEMSVQSFGEQGGEARIGSGLLLLYDRVSADAARQKPRPIMPYAHKKQKSA